LTAEKQYNVYPKGFLVLQKHKSLLLFVLKAVCIYLGLYVLFLGYVGLVDIKGSYYSPFLARFSILDLLLQGLIYPAKYILKIFGFEVMNALDWITIHGARGVRIAFPCLGVEIMIALFSLIISYPAKGKKALFIILGFVIIHIINIFRVVAILLTNHYSYELTSPSHTIFNTIVYGFVIFYFYSWIKYFTSEDKLLF
jgi:exosortase/archaeosortase family protein